jgi:hypothetical protein
VESLVHVIMLTDECDRMITILRCLQR